MPRKPYGSDLKGRIDYLADNQFLSNDARLHLLRDTRNALAHEPTTSADWANLDTAVLSVFAALRELALPVELPTWDCIAERSGALQGKIPDAICSFEHAIAIKNGDSRVATITWSTHLMKDDA